MINFSCGLDEINKLLIALSLVLTIERPHYFEIRRSENNKLVGYWNDLSGDGEIIVDRLKTR